jgi:hypothetical protein
MNEPSTYRPTAAQSTEIHKASVTEFVEENWDGIRADLDRMASELEKDQS